MAAVGAGQQAVVGAVVWVCCGGVGRRAGLQAAVVRGRRGCGWRRSRRSVRRSNRAVAVRGCGWGGCGGGIERRQRNQAATVKSSGGEKTPNSLCGVAANDRNVAQWVAEVLEGTNLARGSDGGVRPSSTRRKKENGRGEQERGRMAASEEGVRVVESCFVKPAADTPRKAIWLSPLDIMLARRGYTPLIHFYRPCVDQTSAQDFFDVTRLKSALGKALVAFYPMAGRLRVDVHGRLEIDCNGKGMLFLVAYSRLTIDDFRDLKPSSKLRRFFVPCMDDSSDILCATQV
ncbi:uncharacterized protein [Triticum aestivum]|uniref:uncharacterized protein n=1 Tax=Triticum aestivum TaxID=4565 RepID=UPI001D0075DD|nr:uncharacterized protein LOC123084513 [Triticum aestivum]